MNYDLHGQLYVYWMENIFPHLTSHAAIPSFDAYLLEFSLGKHGRWLRDKSTVRLLRIPLYYNSTLFAKQLKDKCISYCCPVDPKTTFIQSVYQISPTLHLECCYDIWIEAEMVQSHVRLLSCYNNEDELKTFLDNMWSLRKQGEIAPQFKGFGNLSRNS